VLTEMVPVAGDGPSRGWAANRMTSNHPLLMSFDALKVDLPKHSVRQT
jgi:hypothetical protein